MREFHLTIPLRDEDVQTIEIGDLVYFSGEAWTCRALLQKYVFEEEQSLPFSTTGRNVLIHVGPVVIKEMDKWKLLSFAPTSSIRFEKWGARSVKAFGLKAIIGKTTMGSHTQQAMKEAVCIHATPLGIRPNLYLDQIEIKDVFLLNELGSIEAAWILELKDFGPFLVDIDPRGFNYFDELDSLINANRQKAYRNLNIPSDFEYTKLY